MQELRVRNAARNTTQRKQAGSMRSARAFLMITAIAVSIAPESAVGFGPAGHRIASLAAEPLLCEAAVEAIAGLSDGEAFDELGLWADRIRSSSRWDHAAPWHYMNIDDNAELRAHTGPAEGDVLWAIRRFREELSDERLPRLRRAEALKFLIHFVVDIHQPLHVGRAGDRGGNTIEVRYGASTVKLHAFWDSDAVALGQLPIGQFADDIERDVERAYRRIRSVSPLDWAAESLALRGSVYDFGPGGVLDAEYLAAAVRITRQRLGLAAARLAYVLNETFCR